MARPKGYKKNKETGKYEQTIVVEEPIVETIVEPITELIEKPTNILIDGKKVVGYRIEGNDVIYSFEDLTTTKRPL